MITTIDGKLKKRGEWVWEIGWDGTPGEAGYTPTKSKVHHWSLINPDRCWESYGLCLIECEKLNKEQGVRNQS